MPKDMKTDGGAEGIVTKQSQPTSVPTEKGEPMIIYDGHEGKYRVCCSCRHNRIVEIMRDGIKQRENRCDIDGHQIGYLRCFDCWCRHWAIMKAEE